MYAYIWLGLIVLFLLAEAACPIHLVSIWFAAGATVALITALLSGALWLQILLFALVSVGLLLCLWPLVRKVLNPHLTATNVDSVIGTVGRVTVAVCNEEAQGQVKLSGMDWSARSVSGTPIPVGTLIRVERIEGVKVFVSPIEEKATL